MQLNSKTRCLFKSVSRGLWVFFLTYARTRWLQKFSVLQGRLLPLPSPTEVISIITNLIVAGQLCNLNVNGLKHHLCPGRVTGVPQTPALAAGCLRDKPSPQKTGREASPNRERQLRNMEHISCLILLTCLQEPLDSCNNKESYQYLSLQLQNLMLLQFNSSAGMEERGASSLLWHLLEKQPRPVLATIPNPLTLFSCKQYFQRPPLSISGNFW